MKFLCFFVLTSLLFISCRREQTVTVLPPPPNILASGWQLHTGPAGIITDVAFVNPAKGYAASVNSLSQSLDSGKTWTTLFTRRNRAIITINFLNNQYGYFVGDGYGYTTNGGDSWKIVSDSLNFGGGIDVNFFDAATGFIASNNGLFKTTDTGNTWMKVQAGNWSSIYFIDQRNGFAGADGKVLRTTDGGASWSAVISNAGSYISSIQFTDGLHGWITSLHNNLLYRTTDGGITWQSVHLPDHPYDVQFMTSTTGYACAGNQVLRSSDGGQTWTKDAVVYGMDSFYEIFFLDQNTGWASGANSTILRLKK